MTFLLAILLLSVDGPQKVSAVRRAAETNLTVVVVPPDGKYDVTVKPETPAPKGERGQWSSYPRLPSKNTISRTATEWHLKVPPGTYEFGYTTWIDGEQVDSFQTVTLGEPEPPPIPVPPVTDPDFVRLKAAYDTDTPTDAGLRKLNAAVLVKYYRDAAVVCNSSQAANVADFFAEINAKAQSERVGIALPGVRNTVVAPELRKVFPPPREGTQPVSDLQRKSLGATFSKWAALLEGVAR